MENQSNLINVEIVYTTQEKQALIPIEVPADSTVYQAICLAGILTIFPEINLSQQKVGIFSKIVELDTPIKKGDRIEIYRPLKIDPKSARRERARHKKT